MTGLRILLAAIIITAGFGVSAQDSCNITRFLPAQEEDDSIVFIQLNINGKYNDYSPFIFGINTLYFNSDRYNPKGELAELSRNENVYTSQRTGDTTWTSPAKNYFFNTDDQTAICGLSSDEEKLYFYKTYNEGDIYVSKIKKGHWTVPKNLNKPFNTDWHEQSVSEANGTIVITSERQGSIGMHDIFWSRKNENGKYIDIFPINELNTTGDEVDVFLSKDGKKLWFSSNGYGTGNYDIFVSTLNKHGQWGKPEKLCFPVNSLWNDRNFMCNDSMFFLSSDREGSNGELDIFHGYIYKKPQPNVLVLKGQVVTQILEKDTNILIKNDRFTKMDSYFDSIGVDYAYARVQIGAFYNLTIAEFKKAYPSLQDTPVTYETDNKGKLRKFIIDEKYSTIREAAAVQEEMIVKHKIKDAFIPIYDNTDTRIAIYNINTRELIILVKKLKPVSF